ncbi:Tubulin polyglutamylase TTLL5 [Camponotus floridanus]|uniref:Tubulin--tyrosine ligase-like protein 5 n=1 Tax=Camponotus floridanus TaxID=104421 RepID=E2AJG3_CAMFO|nr:Tubulin polyglutamylase TTLL5 [Camponotus floridanus]
MHLCNYSINKFHVDYVKSEDPDAENVGHKWTLSALLRHLRSMGQDTESLMQRIEDIIIKSILATASGIVSGVKQFVKHPDTCFGCSQKALSTTLLFEDLRNQEQLLARQRASMTWNDYAHGTIVHTAPQSGEAL